MKLTLPTLPQDTNRQVYGGRALSGNLGSDCEPLPKTLLLWFDDGLFFGLVFFQQLVVVLVVLEVFEARRRPIDGAHRRQAFEEWPAQGDGLTILEQQSGGQRPRLQHQLLLSGQTLAASEIARRQTCASWDEFSNYDVLFEPQEFVDLARDRGFGEHLGRLLEGRGRQERFGVQRSLGHTQQHWERRGRLATFGPQLAQHLARDDFDVLVVDAHALGPIHLLDFVDEVALNRVAALNAQHFVGILRAFGEQVAGLNRLAIFDLGAGRGGHRVLALFAFLGSDGQLVLADFGRAAQARHDRCVSFLFGRGHRLADLDPRAVLDRRLVALRQIVLVAVGLTRDDLDDAAVFGALQLDHAVELGQDGFALRDARLEQFFHARQTRRDVDP